jgi:hypothetical protein
VPLRPALASRIDHALIAAVDLCGRRAFIIPPADGGMGRAYSWMV